MEANRSCHGPTVPGLARIALDIDSTLHHYWDLVPAGGARAPRPGPALRGTARLGDHALERDASSPASRRPTRREHPGRRAVSGRRRDRSRLARGGPLDPRHQPPRDRTRDATARWLERIGMPYDDLHCSFDKVTRCVELGSTSSSTTVRSTSSARRAAGSSARPLFTPGTRTSSRRDDAIGAHDWAELRAALDPVLTCSNRPRPDDQPESREAGARRTTRGPQPRLPAVRRTTCAATCPASSPSASSTTGAAPSASRASSTRRSSTSSTATGSAPRSRGSRTSRPTGGALLVSNHSGALPPDAAMIAKAIKEEHPHPRPLNITVEHFFKGYPGFSMLIPKIGCVAAHPANVQRLLYDEQQLVLVFPEGRKGTEKLYKDRYKLRRFGRGGFVEAAMRARAPIVPVCVVGAEEAAPIFAQLSAAPAADRPPLLPDHADVPALRAARHARLPARPSSRSASSSPSSFEERACTRTRRSSRPSPTRSARRIQENLCDMVGDAQVGVVRMSEDSKPHPRHRPVDLLGRPAGAGARGDPRSRRSSASTPRTRPASSSAPST